MAKSKSGGTRSYIRGKVGADVYSIGKDGAGKKQQVVRSLAETVANPQTESQMRGRMIMSTVMQAVSAMSPIIDHSFDGIAVGQPSISEFIRRNYALVKADVAENPSEDNNFGLNKYQEKGIKIGKYVVSSGKAILPDRMSASNADRKYYIFLNAGAKVSDLKAFFGSAERFYCTCVGITSQSEFIFARLRLASDLEDETVISSENVSSLFVAESNGSVNFTFEDNKITVRLQSNSAVDPSAVGLIISEKVEAGWQHNDCVLSFSRDTTASYTADIALPTYPLGSQRFLNGGEL